MQGSLLHLEGYSKSIFLTVLAGCVTVPGTESLAWLKTFNSDLLFQQAALVLSVARAV